MVKVREGLEDYFTCNIKFSTDKKKNVWLGQSFLIDSLEITFSEQVIKIHTQKMSHMPSSRATAPILWHFVQPWWQFFFSPPETQT